MTAWTFLIRAQADDAVLGAAVVCPEARHCSIQWAGEARAGHRFVPPAMWRAIEQQLAEPMPGGPLPPASALGLVLRHAGRFTAITFLSALRVDAAPGTETAVALDAMLKQQGLV